VSTKEPLDGVLHLRLSTHEKVLWVEAAGGSRRLSQWVRERCNAAVNEGDVSGASVASSSEGLRETGSTPVVQPSSSLTAANCPQRLLSHVPGTECPKCHTVFPPVALVVEERVFRGMDPKPGKR